ncbi:hypothetical protein IMZ48_10325 [Candidatus Bathyarchaeota archaeon]|nr:hypothetical protein [Candidatus Bathyarchaeota archaeon]
MPAILFESTEGVKQSREVLARPPRSAARAVGPGSVRRSYLRRRSPLASDKLVILTNKTFGEDFETFRAAVNHLIPVEKTGSSLDFFFNRNGETMKEMTMPLSMVPCTAQNDFDIPIQPFRALHELVLRAYERGKGSHVIAKSRTPPEFTAAL